MKKFFLQSFLLVFVFIACSYTSITNDPKEDARNMTEQLVKAAENNDIAAADEILGKYYKVYSKKDLADKIVFFKSAKHSKVFKKSDVWYKFSESKEFKNSANHIRYAILFKETEKEARRLGVW